MIFLIPKYYLLLACEAVNEDLPCMTNGSEVLEHYDFDENNFWMNIISMTVIYIAFHFFGYVLLRRRCKSNGYN